MRLPSISALFLFYVCAGLRAKPAAGHPTGFKSVGFHHGRLWRVDS